MAAREGPVGLVLAGGLSRRLGRDKAALAHAGQTLVERAARRLAAVCREVVAADGGRGLLAGRPSVADGPGAGPAAGILGGAAAYPGRELLVLACDLPLVPPALLVALREAAARAGEGKGAPGGSTRADWVVPRWREGLEPLCALYGPAALAALAAAVARGDAALHRLARRAAHDGGTEAGGLAVVYLEGDELLRCGPPDEVFLNVNTPEDLARWIALEPGAAACPAQAYPADPPPAGSSPAEPAAPDAPGAAAAAAAAAQAAQGQRSRRKSKR
jgi:molybdopterin-guanine dinucleotide biosynthesis protein A